MYSAIKSYVYKTTENEMQNKEHWEKKCLEGLDEWRKEVWLMLIENELKITIDLYENLIISSRAQINFFSDNELEKKHLDDALNEDVNMAVAAANHKQIVLDLPRSSIKNLPEIKKEDLRNVLVSYCMYRPDIGYVQGMAFIASVLLNEIQNCFETFVILTNLMNKDLMHSMFTLNKSRVDIIFEVYTRLLKVYMPEQARILEDVEIIPEYYLINWLMTLFSTCVPFRLLLNLWDRIFFYGEFYIIKICLGFVLTKANAISSNSFEVIVQALANPVKLEEEESVFLELLDSIPFAENHYNAILRDVRKEKKEEGNDEDHDSAEIWDLCDGRVVRTVKGYNDIVYDT